LDVKRETIKEREEKLERKKRWKYKKSRDVKWQSTVHNGGFACCLTFIIEHISEKETINSWMERETHSRKEKRSKRRRRNENKETSLTQMVLNSTQRWMRVFLLIYSGIVKWKSRN
jgi:hypothetical protein